ncbi:MAG: oligosaccharide flippase family protein [Candidatus Roizmanbacteria bacterium]|nr:oligosaccharide flippase family protein [Candidatus Roizmanbacteria bacterium]
MSMKQKVIINTAVQFGGRLLTSFIGFIITVLLARYLGAQGYGIYSKMYALASFFYLVADFGLNAVYIREHKDSLKFFSLLNTLRTLFFALSLALIGIFFLTTGNHIFSNNLEKLAVLLFSPTILFFGYYTSLNAIFQIHLRYELSVLAAIIGGIVGLGLVSVSLPYGLNVIISALVVGYAVTVIVAYGLARQIATFHFFPTLKRLHDPLYKKQAIAFLRTSAPLGMMLFLNTMYARADVFVLSAYTTNAQVGIYQLAYKFFEFPLAFAAFFANAVFPHYVTLYAQNREHFWRVFRRATIALAGTSIVFTVGAWFGAPFLAFVKSDYARSALPLQILSLSYPIFFLTSALSWLAFLQGKEKSLVWVYGTSFLVNIAANIMFVPYYSYIASSWITVAGEVGVLGMLLIVVNIKTPISNIK